MVLRLTPPGAPGAAPIAEGKGLKLSRLSRTKARQRLRRFVGVKVKCAAPCARVTAKGQLAVKRKGARRWKHFGLKPAKHAARKGSATLRLRIRPRARRAAGKALKRGGRVRATVTVTGRSAKGKRLWTAKKRIVIRLGSG